MRCLSKRAICFSCLSFLSIALMVLAACSNQEPVVSEPPTAELAVVVFATEAPSEAESAPEPAATATQNVVAEATPVQAAATVGVGISNASSDEATSSQDVTQVSSADNRAPDINPLTGLKVDDPTLLQRRPLMVRVGNDPAARPQVALNEADMVYEEIVEWWVTRFTAIYLSQDPEIIAPIRSARLINVPLTSQYQGVLANSGGSDGVRWEISQSDIINIDEFFVPGPYFYRPNEGWQTRLGIDATAARDYLANEGLEIDPKLRGFFFSEPLDLNALPEGVTNDALVIDIPYPQQTSATRWEYDQSQGKYLRFVTDEPFMDFNGDQIEAANVIIYFANHQATDIVEDSNGATSIRIIIEGKGAAWLLRDGKIITGNWEAGGNETPRFIFNNGEPMPLKPGNTWVEVVPLEYTIDIDGASYSALDADSSPGR